MKEIFNSFEQSLERFVEILQMEKTLVNRDSAIKRFEFTTELAWKTIQKYLRFQAIVCRSPKECLQEAFKLELVADDPKWISMLQDRNLTVHTYDEKFADEVCARLPEYLVLFEGLRDKIKMVIEK